LWALFIRVIDPRGPTHLKIPKIGADELATTVTATSGALTDTATLTLNVQ